jgi:hypothetical protein
MPFGRGFGFRGWSPPWPYVGRGRGGFPRCWAYGANWDASYSNPYGYGAFPYEWGSPYSPPQESPMMTAEGEKEWLKGQAESIRQEIDQIKNRISQLEKE